MSEHISPESLSEEAQQFADKVTDLVEECLENGNPTSILLYLNGWGLLGSQSPYIERFLHLIPELNASNHIPRSRLDLYNTGSVEIRARLGIPPREPGKKLPGILLHSVRTSTWEEHHVISPSSNPQVFYHYLGSESPGEYGGGGDFLTVNLTEGSLRDLAIQSGARVE